MKTIVVLSDTHGNMRAVEQISGILGECDYIFHLGDTSSDGLKLKKTYGDKVFLINGNCDPFKLGENELVFEIEGVKIFATHGHLYSAKHTLSKLAAKGKELCCRIVLYGHTHAAREDEIDGVTLINPGNFTRYSQNGYCYIAVNDGKFTAKCVAL